MNEQMSALPEWMQDRVVDRGVEAGVEWVTVRAGRAMPHINGYVRVPEGHPWSGLPYSRINGVEIHGGLTYSEDGWIGFDTAHSGDIWPDTDPETDRAYRDTSWRIDWTVDAVAEEARNLARQTASAPETDRPPVYPDEVQAAKDAARSAWNDRNGWDSDDAFDTAFEAGYQAGLAAQH